MRERPRIVNPKLGTIYAVYWKNSNAYYPVMILPWRRFRRLGWKETISQTGLLNHVPACYLFDKKTDQEARGWAKGYEDGGPKMTKRKFPVIYFDEAEFPEGSSVGWVRANALREFDPQDKKIRRRDTVERFLQEHPDFSDSSGSDSTSSDDEDSQASSPSRDEREGSPQEGPARQNSLPTIRSQEPRGGEKAVSAPLSLISIPSDDESDYEGSKEEEGEETNQSRERVKRHRGRAGGVAAASTSAPPASAGGTGGAEKEVAATAQIDPGQDVVPASTRNDNQERLEDRTAGDEDSGRNETAGKNQNRTTNERDKPSPSTTRQHEGPVTSNDIEMNHLSNAQKELAFDFDPLWRQDDLANRLSSPSQDRSQSDIQAELLRGVHQAGAAYETQGNPTTGDIASSANSLPPATYDEPPFNLNNAHVFGQQPVPDQVQGTRYEVESQPVPTPTSTTAATTLPLLRPIEDRNPWKNQPTPIHPMLTADNDQVAMIAAQAVMSHPPKELRGARLPAHETGGLAVGAPNSVLTASLFQFSPNTYMNKNAQSSVSPHPPRRGSGFFDAVLGPRTQTDEQTRVTSTQATPKATEQREVPRSQMDRPRPDVQDAPNSYGSPWLVHARLSADDGTPKGTQGGWRGGSFVS
ncbi:hypothetical protein NCS52_01530300 [Fusarium sp. LHS14.1]|nr:hypothetical protein NCS52_01530300 [Fusarium sp. LHS14.1]